MEDIGAFETFIERMESDCGFYPEHVEYGPGMASEYFNAPYEEKDDAILAETCERLKAFSKKYRLSVEMGRFLASSCGTYLTSVADLKRINKTNYVICDGGIHHIKYYGQTMAMQVPPMKVLNDSVKTETYTLCGSLCTTADILVRKVDLPMLKVGDTIAFERAGAYAVTEGIGLFLSRPLPRVALYSEVSGMRIAREFFGTDVLNTAKS